MVELPVPALGRLVASVASVTIVACGPSVGTGPSDLATGTGASDDAGAAFPSGHVGSSGDATGETTEASPCPHSDLPPPFCHELVEVDWPDTVIGIIEQPREGVRPIVVRGDEEEPGLRVIDPFDASRVFVEGPVPMLERDASPLWSVSGDFDGDGVHDLAIFNPSWTREAVLVDGVSLAPMGATVPAFGTSFHLAAIDTDADGVDELVTVDAHDTAITLSAWRPEGGSLVREATIDVGVGYRPDSLAVADFDGNGRRDLAFAWSQYSEPYHQGAPPEVIALLAPSQPSSELRVVVSPQPVWAEAFTAVDLDADGKSELVLGASVRELVVLAWAGDGFVESSTEWLAAPEEYTPPPPGGRVSDLWAGQIGPDGRGGVFMQGLREPSSGPLESFIGALFPPSVEPRFVVMEQGASPVFDFNADGVGDFVARVPGGGRGVYLSAWAD